MKTERDWKIWISENKPLFEDYFWECINAAFNTPKDIKKPYVGSLILRPYDGGYEKRYGWKDFIPKTSMIIHAEAKAIDDFFPRTDLEGAILFTTLEPCTQTHNKQKRTSCCERILDSGISAVIYGLKEFKESAAHGADLLRDNGVFVYHYTALNKVLLTYLNNAKSTATIGELRSLQR